MRMLQDAGVQYQSKCTSCFVCPATAPKNKYRQIQILSSSCVEKNLVIKCYMLPCKTMLAA